MSGKYHVQEAGEFLGQASVSVVKSEDGKVRGNYGNVAEITLSGYGKVWVCWSGYSEDRV